MHLVLCGSWSFKIAQGKKLQSFPKIYFIHLCMLSSGILLVQISGSMSCQKLIACYWTGGKIFILLTITWIVIISPLQLLLTSCIRLCSNKLPKTFRGNWWHYCFMSVFLCSVKQAIPDEMKDLASRCLWKYEAGIWWYFHVFHVDFGEFQPICSRRLILGQSFISSPSMQQMLSSTRQSSLSLMDDTWQYICLI